MKIRQTIQAWVLAAALALPGLGFAQNGEISFSFLDIAKSARLSALGTEFVSVRDADITVSLSNPSLITSEINRHLGFNYVNHSGINYGFVSYSHDFEKVGNFAFHLQYGNYGAITVTDEMNNEYGTATANDLAAVVGWGRELDSCFTIGANFKVIYSQMEKYHAVGMAVDVAGTYTGKGRLFSISLLLRNMGGAVKSFGERGSTLMPFEVALALSQKIPHTPLRLFFEFPNLQKWDLNYENPYAEKDLVTGEKITRSKAADIFDNLARHIIVGLEIIPYRGFYVRASYNYRRMQDLAHISGFGGEGVSLGAGVRISKFNFSYAWSRYHISGDAHSVSMTLDLDAFKGRRTKAQAAQRQAEDIQ